VRPGAGIAAAGKTANSFPDRGGGLPQRAGAASAHPPFPAGTGRGANLGSRTASPEVDAPGEVAGWGMDEPDGARPPPVAAR